MKLRSGFRCYIAGAQPYLAFHKHKVILVIKKEEDYLFYKKIPFSE